MTLIDQIKERARGSWLEIITQLTGVSPDYFSGIHGPCPRCEAGKDRFRAFDDFTDTGGVVCSTCGVLLADGIATLGWLLNITPQEAISRLAIYLDIHSSGSFFRPELPLLAATPKTFQHSSDIHLSGSGNPDVRNSTYATILRLLSQTPLNNEHLESLRRRGLTDAVIQQCGYATLGRNAQHVARQLDDSLKNGEIPELRDYSFDDLAKIVAGLTRDQHGNPCLPGIRGIVIPVRDSAGRIAALKVRRDDPADASESTSKTWSKYTYISASRKSREERAKRDGVEYPKAMHAVHVPIIRPLNTTTIRVTEGELKADVATLLSGVVTIAIPGVQSWQLALPVLRELCAKRILIALDADHTTNPAVANALLGLARQCVAEGYEVVLEVWDQALGKGVDDALVSGCQVETLGGTLMAEYLSQHVAPVAAKQMKTSGMGNEGGDTTPLTLAKQGPSVTDHAPQRSQLKFRPFPVDLLPSPLREFVRAGATALCCDESYIAPSLLTALAASVGNSRRIRLKRTWCEPCVFWTVVVAESGAMKSPALELAVGAVRKRHERALRNHHNKNEAHEIEMQKYEAAFTEWKRKGCKAGAKAPVKPLPPVCERCLVEDTTVEAIMPLHAENPRGLMVFRDELAGWVNSFDGYKSTKGADVGHWLSMHRAGPVTTDRKTGQRTIHAPRAGTSATGGIQPLTLIEALLGRGRPNGTFGMRSSYEHIANGLLARLLMVMPPKLIKRWSDAEIDNELQLQVEHVFERLAQLQMEVNEDQELVPVDLDLQPEAKACWVEFYNEHAQETGELAGATAAAWSKLEGYAARFALLIHLMREASGETTEKNIELTDIESGIELSRWFGYETRRIYAELGIDRATTEELSAVESRRLVAIALRKGGRLTSRELQRSSRQYRSSAESAENALRVAEREGFFVSHTETETGGRPVLVWAVAQTVDTSPEFSEKQPTSVTVTTTSSASSVRCEQ